MVTKIEVFKTYEKFSARIETRYRETIKSFKELHPTYRFTLVSPFEFPPEIPEKIKKNFGWI